MKLNILGARCRQFIQVLTPVIFVSLAFVTAVARAAPYSAQVDFDFNEGWIQITPPEYRIGARYEGSYKSSGFGLSFDVFEWTTKVADLTADSYLFLTGDPDDLSFLLIQFVCRSGSTTPSTAFSTEWKIGVAKGSLRASSHFLQGLRLHGSLKVDDVCTDDYRLKLADHSFRTIPEQQGAFHQSVSHRRLLIRWDAKNWQDALTRKSQATLQRIDEILR